MNTLFMTIPDAMAARNYLRSSFWSEIRAEKNLRIVLICAPGKVEQYRTEFGGENIIVEAFSLSSRPRFGEKLCGYLSRNGLATGTVHMNQMRQYLDEGGLVSLVMKRCVWYLGKFFPSGVQSFLRFIDLHVPSDPAVLSLFDTYKPDAVFSTAVMNHNLDVPLLREAARRSIPTIGMTRGWDNFTAHGILRILPSRILFQNRYVESTGKRYQHLPSGETKIVGFPQNDWYEDRSLIEPRKEFLQKIGVDPAKRVILFCALGDYLVPAEWEIAEVFEDLMKSGSLPQDLVMVYRAHPSFESKPEKMASLPHVQHERSAKYAGKEVRSWEMGKEEMAHLINAIVHSEMVITTGSTAALDAAALGKPAISVAFERTALNYWLSARRFRGHFTHYQELMETGGVAPADTESQLAEAINFYLQNPEGHREGRDSLRWLFIDPQDGESCRRIAKEVRETLFPDK